MVISNAAKENKIETKAFDEPVGDVKVKDETRKPPVHVVTAKVEVTVKEQPNVNSTIAKTSESQTVAPGSPLKVPEIPDKPDKMLESPFKAPERPHKTPGSPIRAPENATKMPEGINKMCKAPEIVPKQNGRIEQTYRKKAPSQGFIQPSPVPLMPGNPGTAPYPLHVSQVCLLPFTFLITLEV